METMRLAGAVAAGDAAAAGAVTKPTRATAARESARGREVRGLMVVSGRSGLVGVFEERGRDGLELAYARQRFLVECVAAGAKSATEPRNPGPLNALDALPPERGIGRDVTEVGGPTWRCRIHAGVYAKVTVKPFKKVLPA